MIFETSFRWFSEPSFCGWGYGHCRRRRFGDTLPRLAGITELWAEMLANIRVETRSYCHSCSHIGPFEKSWDSLAGCSSWKSPIGPVLGLSVICACQRHLKDPNWLLLSIPWQAKQAPKILLQPRRDGISNKNCSPHIQSIHLLKLPLALPGLSV